MSAYAAQVNVATSTSGRYFKEDVLYSGHSINSYIIGVEDELADDDVYGILIVRPQVLFISFY